MAAVLVFGHVRTLELLATTAAYVGAANSAQGLDGGAAATQYLKANGVVSKGAGSTRVSVEVSRHVSVVNYWEAKVSYTEASSGLLRAVFPDTFSVTRSCRWYVSRAYLRQGTEWIPTDEGVGKGG